MDGTILLILGGFDHKISCALVGYVGQELVLVEFARVDYVHDFFVLDVVENPLK